jgi:zinc protease
MESRPAPSTSTTHASYESRPRESRAFDDGKETFAVKGHSAQPYRRTDRPKSAALWHAVSSPDVRLHVSTVARRHSIPWFGVALLLAGLLLGHGSARAEPRVSMFTLANGMHVVVIPDHRVPVVTHMVWYRAGAADDPWGASGTAHLLEHLMFKSTEKIKSGEFSRIITRLGGRDNALTNYDTTYYFERVAKEYLPNVMALEADRMVNLRFVEEEVHVERDVVQEERRATVEADPVSLLSEQMLAALYLNHPYGRPAFGWAHELAKLTTKDVAAFYERFYAPNNAILVVTGDVTADEVRPLAEGSYGRSKANARVTPRSRPQEPQPVAARRVHVEDARAQAPILLRYYYVPSYASARPGEAEDLELLAQITGGGDTSRLYRRLVAEKLASTAGSNYVGNGLDSGRMAFLAIPLPGVPLKTIEAALDATITDVREKGVTQEELERANAALEARRVFESDDQMALARRYGEGLATGRSIEDIDALPGRIRSRSPEDLRQAAARFLSPVRSVTGTLGQPGATPGITATEILPSRKQ